MKKAYNKPYLLVESFQLDAAIASSCSSQKKQPLNFYLAACTLAEEVPGLGYFGPACEIDVRDMDGDGNDGLCYHGPSGDLASLFMYS